MKHAIPTLLFGLMIGAGPAYACDSLGENMHMGSIVSIDRDNHSFVILDAESSRPIHFTASAEAIAPLSVDEVVEVSYEVGDKGELRSLELIRL
ncbi:MAG: hypothetical protein IT489_03490 [Gammaproteobacteria bacterium]|nr:hypothetical protein [Gammaproteobacteria bacterium]